MIALDGDDVYGIALSGAGPLVIALVRGAGSPVAAAIEAIFARTGVVTRTYDLAIASAGLRSDEDGARTERSLWGEAVRGSDVSNRTQ